LAGGSAEADLVAPALIIVEATMAAPIAVMRGLDPRIHHFRKMDCRVKPGNDGSE
jgi:hypothetical protein